jgi:hypothetical protein
MNALYAVSTEIPGTKEWPSCAEGRPLRNAYNAAISGRTTPTTWSTQRGPPH